MDEWTLCVSMSVCACAQTHARTRVFVGLIGGFQTQEHSSGTKDPVLTLQCSAPAHTRTHYLHLIFVAQSE